MKYWQVLAMTDMDQIPTLARKAEELGFEGITLGDHLITFQQQYESYPESEDAIIRWYPETHWPDPWVQFAAIAQVTTRIKFLTTIFVVPMRDPFSIAKSVSTAARPAKSSRSSSVRGRAIPSGTRGGRCWWPFEARETARVL